MLRLALLAAALLSLALAAAAWAEPETTIDSGPSDGSTVADSTPTFTFSSDALLATFECRVDAEPFAPCSGPGDSHTTEALSDGPHTFRVRAVDLTGPDPMPATRDFTVDTTAPGTTIDSGPSGGTGDATPTFAFSSGDPGATFECRVDEGSFAACSGPGDTHTTSPLPDGPHTFEVRAVDAVGNRDPTPDTRDFTVDTDAPGTTIDSGPSGRIADATPTFAFSSGDPGATFECRVDGGSFDACSGPGDSHTTDPLSDGAHTFEVRAVDAAGNRDPTPDTRDFTVDTDAPGTTIDSGPSGRIADATPTFAFSSGDPGATFECRVDGGSFDACSGPGDSHTTDPLSDGAHTFEVRAVDAAGNRDPTPDTRDFTVDTDAPNTTIDSGPGSITADPTPTFSFSSGDGGATFECRVDGGSFGSCSGPGDRHTTGPLPDGPHTFRVRAVDAVDNRDPTPATRDFTVDTTAPNTTIDSGPNGLTSDPTPTFDFSAGGPGASFQCRVDDGSFGACSGPGDSHTAARLSDGAHTFDVRAVDAADNRDPTPASRDFTVDTTAPGTTITKRPKKKIETRGKGARVVVSFASEPGATYRCKLDKAEYKPCHSPYGVRVKAKGGRKHAISVRAIDKAGNAGKPAVVRFRVARTPRLRAPVARRTVAVALTRHGFAHRVVEALKIDCRRRSRAAFACSFSVRFPGYRLRGTGTVKLGFHLSYGFHVKAQGAHFTLTDENEESRSSP